VLDQDQAQLLPVRAHPSQAVPPSDDLEAHGSPAANSFFVASPICSQAACSMCRSKQIYRSR
jgi:hypothetical protein